MHCTLPNPNPNPNCTLPRIGRMVTFTPKGLLVSAWHFCHQGKCEGEAFRPAEDGRARGQDQGEGKGGALISRRRAPMGSSGLACVMVMDVTTPSPPALDTSRPGSGKGEEGEDP